MTNGASGASDTDGDGDLDLPDLDAGGIDTIKFVVSVEELKMALSSLSAGEQNEISAFLFRLRKLPSATVQEVEHEDWGTLSARGLASAYSDLEPDYTEADIKER